MERPNAGAEEDGREEELHEGEGGEVEVEAHQNGVIVEWPRSVRPFVLFPPTRTKGLNLLVPLLDNALFVGLKLHLPCEVPLHMPFHLISTSMSPPQPHIFYALLHHLWALPLDANKRLIWQPVGDVASGADIGSLIWLFVHLVRFYRL